ncbi:MAG TPA: nucleotide sugar dehydrogenase [Planctomycetota bacterium]|nr:nucleotide sugar dehydrogenase [Planctomycetota bacterium]
MVDIVIIGGCGHVGLPLGLAFARAGKKVVAVDNSTQRVAMANEGVMPFADEGADELLPQVLASGNFRATTDPNVISDAEVVITVIGTPLDEHLNPRFEVYKDLIDEDRSHLRSGQLLILRSTVYPGTTERMAKALVTEGFDIDVAFCPERVAEGFALKEIAALPQIISGCNERAQRRAEELFKGLTPWIIPLEPLAAELAKLYNNSWRYIQFAVANQFYMIANDYGIDFYKIHQAMTDRYPRAREFPRAGFAAGPCLFKDTMQLSCFNNNALFLGHAAMLVNEGLPNYIVRRARQRFDLSKMTVGILGMTFKADSDDGRDSLSFKLKKSLMVECREVLCSDPFLPDPAFTPLEETIARSDVLFIGAPHTMYKSMDFGSKPVIDIWNATKNGMTII